MNFEAIKTSLRQLAQPQYRFDQLLTAVNSGVEDYHQIKGWPKSLIQTISGSFPLSSFISSQTYQSDDGTVKAALTLTDNQVIETVLMAPKPKQFSVCVSCEIGCPMGCSFCATGKQGLSRPLTAEEITDQWLFWLNYAQLHRIPQPHHLVFMGMGEPFHNQSPVFAALDTFHLYYRLGWRKLSISTCGLTQGILALAHRYPQVNLAISLHAATDSLRSQLMPVNLAYPLSTLFSTLKVYLQQTNRQLMFEYLLISGVNDSASDRQTLIKLLKTLPTHLVHLNLIRYNSTGSFTAPSQSRVGEWKQAIKSTGISVTIRKNLGTDISGACGQLAFHSA